MRPDATQKMHSMARTYFREFTMFFESLNRFRSQICRSNPFVHTIANRTVKTMVGG